MRDAPRIHPQMIVAEMLRQHPPTAWVLLERRMACVGCTMAAFETVEEVAQVYGQSLESLLEALRQGAAAAQAGPADGGGA